MFHCTRGGRPPPPFLPTRLGIHWLSRTICAQPPLAAAATTSNDRRFYSNKYTDSEKQDAINLFLGNFVPRRGRPQLWELDSDQYLHADPWDIYNRRIDASHAYTTGGVGVGSMLQQRCVRLVGVCAKECSHAHESGGHVG